MVRHYLLALLLVGTLVLVWIHFHQPADASSGRESIPVAKPQAPSTTPDVTFTGGVSGQMVRHGRSVDFQVFQSSDGVQLQMSVETFRTTAQAQNEVERSVANAAKVVERVKNKGGIGQPPDRVVIYRRTKDPSRKVAIMWTVGRDVHVIDSSSLKHALLFEKWRTR